MQLQFLARGEVVHEIPVWSAATVARQLELHVIPTRPGTWVRADQDIPAYDELRLAHDRWRTTIFPSSDIGLLCAQLLSAASRTPSIPPPEGTA